MYNDGTLFILILTFFANTFFYKQLDLRLPEILQEILFCCISVESLPFAKSALCFNGHHVSTKESVCSFILRDEDKHTNYIGNPRGPFCQLANGRSKIVNRT